MHPKGAVFCGREGRGGVLGWRMLPLIFAAGRAARILPWGRMPTAAWRGAGALPPMALFAT